MKKLNSLVLFIGMLGVVTFMISCEEDKCADVNCGDNGICIDGICNCDDWYSGTNCEAETRVKFFGFYDGFEVCSRNPGNTYNYDVNVGTNADGVGFLTFENLYNIGFTAKATLTGDNTFEFDNQSQDIVTNTWTLVSGTGSIDGTTITINYTMEVGGDQDTCTLTLYK